TIAFRLWKRSGEQVEVEKGTPARRITICIGRGKAVVQQRWDGKEYVTIRKYIRRNTRCQDGLTRDLEVTRAGVTAENRGPVGETAVTSENRIAMIVTYRGGNISLIIPRPSNH